MSYLSNKTALITGATKGMGLAITEILAKNEYNLLLCARDASALENIQQRLKQEYPAIEVNYYACDLSDKPQLRKLAQWILKQDRIDILINNAGMYRQVSILDESAKDYEDQMQLNYYAPYYLSQTVGRSMQKNRRGHIINISSIASRAPVAEASTYTVTKYAIRGLTQVIRDELRPHGIKVTEIIPGSTLTSSWEGTDIPSERFVLPGDIARAVLTSLQMSDGANIDEIMIMPTYGNI